MQSRRRSCSGRAAVTWVPWLAVTLLAVFSLVQLRGRGKSEAPPAVHGESGAKAAAPIVSVAPGTQATDPGTDFAHALALDEEVLAASQDLRKTREALEGEQRALAAARAENLRLAVARDAWRAAAEAAAKEAPADDTLPGEASGGPAADAGALAEAEARVRELEAELAKAGGPAWKDLLAKDAQAKEAARAALTEHAEERSVFREALGSGDATARRAARVLFEGEEAPVELVGPALQAAAAAGDTGLLDAIGIDAALQPMAFLHVGGEEPATSTLLAWLAGRSATLTDEERAKARTSVAGSASYDGPWVRSAWFHLRLLARLDPAAALATSPAPYDANTPIELVEAVARQGEGALAEGSGDLALRALLEGDLAIRRAAAVVARRVYGSTFDIDPAADAETRAAGVARFREGLPR